MAEEKYMLTLTRDQAEVVKNALELFARLKIGQFNRITEMMLNVRDVDDLCKRRDEADRLLKSAACFIYGRNPYGQPDAKQDDLYHRAWSVYEIIRYTMAWYDNPDGGFGCCYDEPMPYGDEPRPECGVIEFKKCQLDIPGFDDMNQGERIKALRESRGMSMAELARSCGIGRSTLHSYESGRREQIMTPVLRAIAEELNYPVEFLTGENLDEIIEDYDNAEE